MAVIVTGATGHLGPHLIAELLRSSHFDRVYVVGRSAGESAGSRVHAVERVARAIVNARGADAGGATIAAIDSDRFAAGAEEIEALRDHVTVIVHAAADTRFGAPLELLRRTNVEATRAMCRFAETCPRLRQLLFVSTGCVAGRRRGLVRESLHDNSAGFANAYEQTKWEAEQIVADSQVPARIARLTTCAGSHLDGYVHRFGAVHHVLHWMSRGLLPMIPGTLRTPIDLLSTDVAGAWLARAATKDPCGLEVCHVSLGRQSIPLGDLLDFVIPLLDDNRRGRVQRPLVVEEGVFNSFNRMVGLSGDALFGRVQASAAAVLPSLLHPKVYETSAAERCWSAPLPHPDWRLLLERVIAFGHAQRWGMRSTLEPSHA